MKTKNIYVGLILVAALSACNKKEEAKPVKSAVPITAATVIRQNLPITESAVGAETSVGSAQDYDPTQNENRTYFVRLPFPEQVALRLKIGQAVKLNSFAGSTQTVTGSIKQIRPPLNATTLAREVIVAVSNAGNWRPAGSIRGEVVLGVRHKVTIVPEQAVVIRPSGSVVYVLNGDVVKQQSVTTGLTSDGVIEITSGVSEGQRVAVDGAALLTDNISVSVREPAATGEKKP